MVCVKHSLNDHFVFFASLVTPWCVVGLCGVCVWCVCVHACVWGAVRIALVCVRVFVWREGGQA